MENYKVSVAVLTYNPKTEKLLSTLRSILKQKNIRFQIVIADDGSAESGFSAAEQFFKENGFVDYVFVANEVNRGTVYNVYSAIERCDGTYIKLISPGDLLSNEDTLQRWIDAMETAGAALSCAEAVYYLPRAGVMEPVARKANPQYITCYLKNRVEEARYNYLVLGDLFLGAATICRKDVQKKYVEEILGKIIYAEDHMYRLMAYDRVSMHYFPECGVLYETTTGISTSGNEFWSEKLKEDWNAASSLLLKRSTGKDPVDRYLRRVLTLPEGKIKTKLLKYLTVPGMLLYSLRRRYVPRKSAARFSDNR